MLKSFVRLLEANLGFVADDLVTFQISTVPEKYKGQSALNLLDRFRSDIAALRGAQNASYANGAPLVNTTTHGFVRNEDDMHDLKAHDRADTPKIVVIDDDLAKEVFPGQEAGRVSVERLGTG